MTPLAAGEYQSGGKIWDSNGRPVVKARATGAPLQAGDYYSGGRLFDANGYEIVYSSTAGGGGPTQTSSDDFSTDTRSGFTYLTGAAADLSVSAGGLHPATTGIKLFTKTGISVADAFVKWKLNFGAGADQNGGPAVRVQNSTNFLMAIINSIEPALKLYHNNGGALTQLGPNIPLPGWAAGTDFWLIAGCIGNKLAAAVYDTNPSNTEDATPPIAATRVTAPILTAGGCGFWGNPTGLTATYDDFAVYTATKWRLGFA